MTDHVSGSVAARLRQLVYSVNGLVALIGIVALIIGIFAGSPVGRIAGSLQPDSGPAFSRIFRMRLKETAKGSKFFVLRIAFTASARRTASTRSSAPAANAALTSS